jgi:alpha-tubulin suppressor-like RCC1 family protein
MWGSNAYNAIQGSSIFASQGSLVNNSYTFLDIVNGQDAAFAIVDDNGIRKAVAIGRNLHYSNGVGSTSQNIGSWMYCIDENDNHMTDVSEITGNNVNSFILKSDGSVWAAGRADLRALGNYSTNQSKFVPVQETNDNGSTFTNLTGVTKLINNGGSSFSIGAIKETGELLLWGLWITGKNNTFNAEAQYCGNISVNIPGETIVDAYLYVPYSSLEYIYIKTASNKFYKYDYNGVPTEDIDMSPESPLIGGTGKYIVKLVRTPQGLIALNNTGDVYYKGKFIYGEAPYEPDINSNWQKHEALSNIADIESMGAEYKYNVVDNNGVIRTLGQKRVYDFYETPYVWKETNWFSGINVVQWASSTNYVIVLDDQKNLYLRTFLSPIGPYQPFSEYPLMTSGDVIQVVVGGWDTFILKNDGTAYLFEGRYTGDITQWGDDFKDTVQFTMITCTGVAQYALDSNGDVYIKGTPIPYSQYPEYQGVVHFLRTTRFYTYDVYKTGVVGLYNSKLGTGNTLDNRKIISIYATDIGMYLLLEGGYVSVLGAFDKNEFGVENRAINAGLQRVIVDNNKNPINNVVSITGGHNNGHTIYTTSTGLTYYAGKITNYTIGSNINREYESTCYKLEGFNNLQSIMSVNTAVFYKDVNGDTYIVGYTVRNGAANGNDTNINSERVSTPFLLNTRIGSDFTIKDFNRNFIYDGSPSQTTFTSLTNRHTGSALKDKIKELVLTQSHLYTQKQMRISSQNASNLFASSFASELSNAVRNILVKFKTNGKYVLTSDDVTNLNNGDVLYFSDSGTTTGTPVTFTLDGVDYTYTLFTDKLTYNGTDYAVEDTVTFGSLNLVVKGFQSTEFSALDHINPLKHINGLFKKQLIETHHSLSKRTLFHQAFLREIQLFLWHILFIILRFLLTHLRSA